MCKHDYSKDLFNGVYRCVYCGIAAQDYRRELAKHDCKISQVDDRFDHVNHFENHISPHKKIVEK